MAATATAILRGGIASRGHLFRHVHKLLRRHLPPANAAPFSSVGVEADDPHRIPASSQPPTQESILYVLKKLGKDPDKAVGFFRSAADERGFRPGAAAYELMLRNLAGRRDSLKDFWKILRSMDVDGHSIDDGAYVAMAAAFKAHKLHAECAALAEFRSRAAARSGIQRSIGSIAKAVVDLDSGSWKIEIEEKSELAMDESLVVSVLRELRDHPGKALVFFRWAGDRCDLGAAAYNAVARVLGRRKETSGEIRGLLREMKEKGHDVDIDTYAKLLKNLHRGRRMEESVELYEMMMDGPYKPSVQDTTVLLRQLSLAAPDLELVFRVARKFEAAGYSMSKPVYDVIHRSLAGAGRFEDAEAMMETMRNEGHEPDNITYSQLVFGLCKAVRLEDARKVLDEMEERGIPPDVKTWTVLIQGHISGSEVSKAVECLTVMLEKGVAAADGDLLDVMVKGMCGENRRVESAYTLFVEMVERARVKPWQATFKHLIQELLRHKKLEEALKLLVSMRTHKFPPFPDPFPAYIARFGTAADAAEFLGALTANTHPSLAAYSNVFRAFFQEGRHSEAQDLLFKCPHHIRKHADISKLFGSAEAGYASKA